jgi:hypothetical protein
MAKAMDKHILPQHQITQRFGPRRIQVLFVGGKGEQGRLSRGGPGLPYSRRSQGLFAGGMCRNVRGVCAGTKITLAHAF